MQKPYQNYKPVDFLKDERFIKWQLFPDEEIIYTGILLSKNIRNKMK